MENKVEQNDKIKSELELSSVNNKEDSSASESESEDSSSAGSVNDSVNTPSTLSAAQAVAPVAPLTTPIKVKGRGNNYYRTPAREAQFAASRVKRTEMAKQRKAVSEKEKETQKALLEIEKIKIELKHRDTLQEAERLRNLLQTAPPVSLTVSPHSAQTQEHLIKSETKMASNSSTQFELEIEEVPITAASTTLRENVKRKASDYFTEENQEHNDSFDFDQSSDVSNPQCVLHPAIHNRVVSTHSVSHSRERHDDPVRHGAGNWTKESGSVDMADDDNLEYAEILAEAKRVVAERRRVSAMSRVEQTSENIPIRSKIQRPSEASRYLQHTQMTAQQQFTQRVVPKAINDEFIWM